MEIQGRALVVCTVLCAGCGPAVELSSGWYEMHFVHDYKNKIVAAQTQLVGPHVLEGARSPQDRDPAHFSRDCSIAVAISGGGTISASFSYGVMRELAEVRDWGADQTSLINSIPAQLDYISTASGGGITGAILSSVLMNDVNSLDANAPGKIADVMDRRAYQLMFSEEYMTTAYLATRTGQQRLMRFRNHLPFMLFGGDCDRRAITFGDMYQLNTRSATAPLWIANATGYADGRRVPLTLHNLEQLNVERFPPNGYHPCRDGQTLSVKDSFITEALSASMAFPSIGPFRLATRSDGGSEQTWIDLVDGGLADNIGLKTALDAVATDLGVDLEEVAALKNPPAHPANRGIVVVIDSSLDADAGLGSRSGAVPGGSDYVEHAASVELMSQYTDVHRYGGLAREAVASISSRNHRSAQLDIIYINARDVVKFPGDGTKFSACAGLQPGEKRSGEPGCTPLRPEKFWTTYDTILPSFRTSAAISYQDADVLMQLGRFMARKHLGEIKESFKRCVSGLPE
jgi:predicted acylesterase/phospholipase RssA